MWHFYFSQNDDKKIGGKPLVPFQLRAKRVSYRN